MSKNQPIAYKIGIIKPDFTMLLLRQTKASELGKNISYRDYV